MMRRVLIWVAAATLPAIALAQREAPPLRAVLIVAPSASESLVRGARFGADEARRTAALLGRDFALEVVTVEGAEAAAKKAAELRNGGVVLIAAGLGRDAVAAMTANDESLVAILSPEAPQIDGVWRIDPPSEAYAEVLRRSRAAEPEAAPARAAAWHSSLTRFGAGELNERFTADTGASMDEQAWFGWLAVKLVAEAGFRNRKIGEMRIDGHKGVALRFDEQRRLVQPLYRVISRNGKEVAVYD